MKKAAKSWIIVVGSLVILGLSTWLSTKGELVLGEEYILGLAYNFPEELRLYFLVITMLGSAWILAIVLCSLYVKDRLDIALRIVCASGLSYLIVGLLKEFVGRPRPGLISDVLQRELLVYGNGFPSGHTALATTIALILGVYIPKKRQYIIPIWIGAVAISRLYLGVHAPLDIVGGFCIGLLSVTTILLMLPPGKTISKIRVAKSRERA